MRRRARAGTPLSGGARNAGPRIAIYSGVMPEPTVTAVIGPEGYTTSISAAGHHLTADEPESAGGADRGPDPYALLLSSLGACKLITLRMYADRKGWPLERASIGLSHHRQHAKDCEDCESTEGTVSRIEAALELDGDLTDEQRARLLEIADRCPVHKTLTGEIVIKSDLAG